MKPSPGNIAKKAFKVVPYIGTWIETERISCSAVAHLVVPYIGTWIETGLNESKRLRYIVVPYIGTWIETGAPAYITKYMVSYLI